MGVTLNVDCQLRDIQAGGCCFSSRLSGIILSRTMAIKKKHRDRIAEALADPDRITEALAKGVREALIKHKQAGNPIVIWRDGKIVTVKPEEITVPN